MQTTNVVKPKSETFKFLDGIYHPFLLNIGGWCMALGLPHFRLFQKAEIQHWWTALCSDLCYWFSNLFDEGHLVAKGSHGPSGSEEWQALPASQFAAMPTLVM